MSNILNGITEAKRSPEPNYDDPSWDEKVSNVGQKAKQAEILRSKGKEPRTRWNPVTKKYYVDFGDRDEKKDVDEDFNGEYDDEAGMAESNLHTLNRAVEGLMNTIDSNDNLPEWCQEKIAKAEGMLTSVWDYLVSQKEQGIEPKQDMSEVAPPGAKAERMVKHIKKGYAKDGKLTPKEKSIAYATTWKAHNAGKVEEDCWDGYEQIGMKEKGGKTVPNCVPKGK